MDLSLTLERVVKLTENDEEAILEILKRAEFIAMQKIGRLPTLTELLYHRSEEEILDIGELFG